MSKNMEQKIDVFFDWIKENKDQVIIIGAVVLFLIALIPLISNYNAKKMQEVLQIYSQTQSSYYQGDFKKTVEFADNFLGKYNKKRDLTKLVLYIKANALYSLEKYNEAGEIYISLMKTYPKDYLLPNFIDGLAYCYEMQGKYKLALDQWNTLIAKYSDNYLAPNAYKGVARSFELLDDYKKADDFYEIMITMFQKTAWAEFAKNRLAYLTAIGKIQPKFEK
jgi:tetratricopeptide (TPR) repeat protein